MNKGNLLCIVVTLLLAITLLAGCSAEQAFSSSDASTPQDNVESDVADEYDSFPPELLEWVADSGWDIPEEMLLNQSLPVPDSISGDYPESFFITTDSHLYERQVGNSCSAYASAYLLRTLGEDVAGQPLYDSMGYRITDGLVLPQGVIDAFADAGHPVDFYTGSLEQLKARLSADGHPIVLLVGNSLYYQHYITLVGYDPENLYFFDSNQDDNPGEIYNSVLSSEEFLPMWENIIPGFECIYFGVK